MSETHIAAANLSAGQRALLQHKIHIDDRAWAHSSAALQRRLPSVWNAALRLAGQLRGMPDTALNWWAAQPHGHILLTAHEDGYAPTRTVGDRTLTATALVALPTILDQPAQARVLALHPLDHLLGSGGVPGDPWLSDGSGCTPRWQRIGAQIASLFELGYGSSTTAQRDPHWYLAEAITLAIDDRQRLNVADPKMERLLTHSVLATGFWHNFVDELAQTRM